MRSSYHFARFCATAGGFALLAASTYAITHGDPFAVAHLPATALAVGVGLAAALAPRLQAGWLGGGLVALFLIGGEFHNLIRTAEHTITVRDERADEIRTANALRIEAEAALEDATQRVSKAQEAVTAADAAIAASAKEKGCRSECSKLLTAAKASAVAERDAARSHLEASREVLKGIPVERSTSPLADRVGVPAWAIDVLAGSLLALCLNWLAALLIALGNKPVPVRDDERSTAKVPEITAVDFLPAQSEPEPEPTHKADDRLEKVSSFIAAYRARHGVDPSFSTVRAELQLPAATASRLRRKALG